MTTILRAFAAFALAIVSFSASAASIWLADALGNFYRLDTATSQIAVTLAGVAPKDAAMLPDGGIWVLGQGHLRKLDTTGATVIDQSLQTDNLVGARVLARDRYSAHLWAGDVVGTGGTKLVAETDPQGVSLGSFSSPGAIRAIAVDLDPSIWLLASSQVLHDSPVGALLGSADLHTSLATAPTLMSVDAIRDVVWVAGGSQVAALDGHSLTSPPRLITLPEAVMGIDVDDETGALWVATLNGLRTYAADGTLIRTIATSSLGISSPQTVAFDPVSRMAWLGHASGVASFGRDGSLGANISVGQAVIRVTASAFIPAPVVAITAPANGAVITAPASFTLAASATELGPAIAKVEFFRGTTSIGVATAAPYSVSVAGLAAGTYSFTAVATDVHGTSTTSGAVGLISNAPPTVSLTAPANGAILVAPAAISVSANAADSDGSIAKVDFYQGMMLVGTVTAPPYSVTLSSVGSGSYAFTAVATDNLGASTTSAAAAVTVDAPPTVAIASPANNAIVTAPATVTITANAADSDGSVAKVDFYQATTLIGTATAAPYSATAANLAAGTYTFSAKATDNLGVESTLASVSILVNAPPTASITAPANNAVVAAPATVTVTASAADSDGTVAKVDFYRGGVLFGTSASAPYAASTASLASGTYVFTATATDNLGATGASAPVSVIVDAPPTVSITAPANNTVVNALGSVSLAASAADSDGSVTKVDFYQGPVLVGTSTATPYAATVSNLAAGSYAFTAVATDDRGLSTTSAPVTVIVNAPPTVAITNPADGAVFPAPATLTVAASASDSDGSVARVDFYQGSTLVGTATSAPYTASLSNLAAGSYVLTAKATDDRGAVTTSSAVTILVHAAPSVALMSPASGASFRAPATIALAATAAASDGAVAKVEFFQGTTLIATVTAAPYTFSWTNVAAGSYALTARATDDRGFSTTSSAVSVTVSAQLAIFYIHTDHLGTPREITQSTDNQIVWRWDNTEPFGNSQPNQDPSGLGAFAYNLRFPGQYFDQETGTRYNYFRDYDPAIGRYVQSDPIGLRGGINTFGYVDENPLALIDPLGLQIAPGGTGAAAAGDAAAAGGVGSGSSAISKGLSNLIKNCFQPPKKPCKLFKAEFKKDVKDFDFFPNDRGAPIVRFGGRVWCHYRCPSGDTKVISYYTGPSQVFNDAGAWGFCPKEEEE